MLDGGFSLNKFHLNSTKSSLQFFVRKCLVHDISLQLSSSLRFVRFLNCRIFQKYGYLGRVEFVVRVSLTATRYVTMDNVEDQFVCIEQKRHVALHGSVA